MWYARSPSGDPIWPPGLTQAYAWRQACMPSCYLTCPAYAPVDTAQSAAAIERARTLLAPLGWTLSPSPLLERPLAPGSWHHLEDRLADWREGQEHDAIWAFRGGYGAMELALNLATETQAQRLPRLVGYSDITALHVLYLHWSCSDAIYGPVAANPISATTASSLHATWQRDQQTFGPHNLPHVKPLRNGKAHGPVVTVCLRILAALAGTPLQPDLRGCLLVIEDIDERPYAVDRDLVQLAACGCLNGIVGLIANDFPHDQPEHYGGPDHAAIISAWADRLAIPALGCVSIGHSADPICLRQGIPGRLMVDADQWHLVQG